MNISKLKNELSPKVRVFASLLLSVLTIAVFIAWRVAAQDARNEGALSRGGFKEDNIVTGQPAWFSMQLIPSSGVGSSMEHTRDLREGLAAGRDQKTQVELLEAYVESYPQSQWTPSIECNLGKYYWVRGRYTPALAHMESAWEACKKEPGASNRQVAEYAFAHWTRYLASMGRYDQLRVVYQEAKEMRLQNPALAQMDWLTREAVRRAWANPEDAYKCGIISINAMNRTIRGENQVVSGLVKYPESGCSLKGLMRFSDQLRLNMTAVERVDSTVIPVPSVVHYRQNHYVAVVERRDNIYLVEDPAFPELQIRTAEDINSEASGKFLAPLNQIGAGWRVMSEMEADQVLGRCHNPCIEKDDRICTSPDLCECPAGSHGGPDPNVNRPRREGPDPGCRACGNGLRSKGIGMPVWEVSEPHINLWLHDTPLSYQPALGDRIALELSFKQRDEFTGGDSGIFGFGAGWHSPWLSFVSVTVAGTTSADVTLPGEGKSSYYFTDLLATNYHDNSTMEIHVDNDDNITSYELTHRDGTKYFYEFFRVDTDGNWNSVFLSRKRDPQGHETQFTYSTTQNPYNPATQSVRLWKVTDADGHEINLEYNSNNQYYPNLVSRVTDPHSRQASMQYDYVGNLTNITDTIQISSGIEYNAYHWPTRMVTPYGATTFNYQGNYSRVLTVSEPDLQRHVYVYEGDCASTDGQAWMPEAYDASLVPDVPYIGSLDNTPQVRNSFYWGPKQSEGLPDEISNLTPAQFMKARMRHWLRGSTVYEDVAERTLSFERSPSPDGSTQTQPTPGQLTWYDYAGKPLDENNNVLAQYRGAQVMPSIVARVLPNVSPKATWYRYDQHNQYGKTTNSIDTYTLANGSVGIRTNRYVYDSSGIDLLAHWGPDGNLVIGYGYDASHPHQPVRETNGLNEITYIAYDSSHRLSTMTTPGGLVTTYSYYAADARLYSISDQPTGRSEYYTWQYGLMRTKTDSLGLTTTHDWDNLLRPTRVTYPDGTYVEYTYNRLDLASQRDRMGCTATFGYNSRRQRVAETNAQNQVTFYGYCPCGPLENVTNALQQVTTYYYDDTGRKTFVQYPDDSYNPGDKLESFEYNAMGQLVRHRIGSTSDRTFGYNNQGLLTVVSNSFGMEQQINYDIEDRPVIVRGADGVTVTNIYDALGRISRKIYPDSGAESYVYDARGLAYYTNALNKVTQYQFDAAGRKTNEVTAKSETIQYAYNAAGQLLTLRDGRSNYTRWEYDAEGRMLVKKDHNQAKIQTNSYNANGWLVRRWTPAKGLTQYDYNRNGSLTNVNYPASTDIVLQYDALERVTNQVDAIGTTRYTYNALGRLRSEDGPWASDTITYDYHATIPHRLTGLTLQQPLGNWTQTYGYDTAGRMQTLASPAGTFTYGYKGALTLRTNLSLPNNASITNDYDNVARLSGTWLRNIAGTVLNKHLYLQNVGGQRYRQTRSDNSYVNYTYDNDGQLESALGYTSGGTPIATEQKGYAYDMGWNLNSRTNNGAVSSFSVNSLNQLTSIPGGTCTYDGNGNLTGDGSRTFSYDDDDQLTQIIWGSGSYRTDLAYDARHRLRKRTEYYLSNGSWSWLSETRYIYDGMRMIQERDSANAVLATYTRGSDLSGSLEGAGGIGGLLARTTGYGSGTVNHYYHADGSGNITAMIDSAQALSASYRYDSFGNLLSSSGSMAGVNMHRFSSKMQLSSSVLLYYYGYRFYDPNLQRWLNRDPIGENGGINLYRFSQNSPTGVIDSDGRIVWLIPIIIGGAVIGAVMAPATVNAPGPDDPVYPALTPEDLGIGALGGAIGGAVIGVAGKGLSRGFRPVDCPNKAINVAPYKRVKLSKGTRAEIFERAKGADGKVYDPSGVEIKPGEPWEAGHRPGHKFSDAQKRAAQEGWDQETWKAYQRDPDIYRPEKPSTNSKHEHESDW